MFSGDVEQSSLLSANRSLQPRWGQWRGRVCLLIWSARLRSARNPFRQDRQKCEFVPFSEAGDECVPAELAEPAKVRDAATTCSADFWLAGLVTDALLSGKVVLSSMKCARRSGSSLLCCSAL